MPAANQRFLDPRLLVQLRSMELRVKTVVEGFLSGLHRSPYRGLSSEFAEYRQYQPGDDLARLDWKAYARSDRYYIKEFEDETNLEARLVLDASASMGFGSGAMTKWQYGATMAACLAYLLQLQNDAVSLVVLSDTVRVETPAKATRGHLIDVVGELERVEPSRSTGLAEVLHHVAGRSVRRGITVVISDLLDDPEAVIAGLRHAQFRGNDVVVLHVLDAAERGFTFEGPCRFYDPESGAEMLTLADDVKDAYLESLNAFIENYAEELGKTNIAYCPVNTGEPLDRVLLAFLAARERAIAA